MLEHQREPEIVRIEWGIFADQYDVRVTKREEFGAAERDRREGVPGRRGPPHVRPHLTVPKVHVGDPAMVHTMPAGLHREHQRKGGVFVRDDGRDGIHDDDEAHGHVVLVGRGFGKQRGRASPEKPHTRVVPSPGEKDRFTNTGALDPTAGARGARVSKGRRCVGASRGGKPRGSGERGGHRHPATAGCPAGATCALAPHLRGHRARRRISRRTRVGAVARSSARGVARGAVVGGGALPTRPPRGVGSPSSE